MTVKVTPTLYSQLCREAAVSLLPPWRASVVDLATANALPNI